MSVGRLVALPFSVADLDAGRNQQRISRPTALDITRVVETHLVYAASISNSDTGITRIPVPHLRQIGSQLRYGNEEGGRNDFAVSVSFRDRHLPHCQNSKHRSKPFNEVVPPLGQLNGNYRMYTSDVRRSFRAK